MDKPGFVDVYPASRVPRNLRHHFKSVYRFNSGSFEKQSNQFSTAKQKGLRIVTDSENLSSALRCISDEEVSMSCSTCKTSGTFIDPICLSQIKMHDSIEQCLNFLCHHPLSLLIDSITVCYCTDAYHQSSDSVNLTISNFPKVRKQVYIVGNSEPRENIGVLNELIDARDELAKVLRFLHILKLRGFIIQILVLITNATG